MNPFYARVIGSIVRTTLIAAGGGTLFSDDEIEQLVGAALLIAGAAWSLYEKYATSQAAEKPSA